MNPHKVYQIGNKKSPITLLHPAYDPSQSELAEGNISLTVSQKDNRITRQLFTRKYQITHIQTES